MEMTDFASTPIKYLKGIGDVRGKLLASELEISTFMDLLEYYPFRYHDRSKFYKINEFSGEMPAVQVMGHFLNIREEGIGAKRRLVGAFTDGERVMEVVWFGGVNKLKRIYMPMTEYVIFGKPTYFNGTWNMVHPEVDKYDPQRTPTGLQGVYSMTERLQKRGMTQRIIRSAALNLLIHPLFEKIPETLPQPIIDRFKFPSLKDAYRSLHNPQDLTLLRRARERMKFEELFYLELQILRYSNSRHHNLPGHKFPAIGRYFNEFYSECIPFELTLAQKRVLKEIRADMKTGRQMNRLLQGDVGSGKTMVAFMSMLMAVDNGFQAAIMAPTEILAGQHYQSILDWCEMLGLRVELLTGSTRAKKRRDIHEGLISGDVNIIVGTHALLEEKVKFASLGLAVIDEQHRFGVAQRARMWGKGVIPPHVLVMTATPIPRTLAMTLYGDLDVSVIDELPPGRKPIETWLRFDGNRGEVNRHIARQISEGRQVYIVYPLIHENEKLSLKSLEGNIEKIREIFPEQKVAFIHGQMKPMEKEYQMSQFVEGKAAILVATTVIEVGVNVPNATVMIIENAERFGLSQLHQLRGRVGRGADRSWCILMSHEKMSATTRKRLRIMTETTDGFLVAEADLKLRGPGDMEGTQQSGIAFNLKIANLATDGQIVQAARDLAEDIIAGNPVIAGLDKPEMERASAIRLSNDDLKILARELTKRFSKDIDWSLIS